MNIRQLKKRDKKAMEILIGVYGCKRSGFYPSDYERGRIEFWYRCSWDCVEYDCKHAYDEWADRRAWEHPNAERWYGFDPETGEPITEDKRPRKLGHREAREFYKLVPPPGYRWRGKRVVKVVGAMLAAKEAK